MPMMYNWMTELAGNDLLSQITMPGSHDAGIYQDSGGRETSKKGVAPINMAICQDRSIYEQCIAGSRFFDVRLKESGGEMRTYHLALKQGALGQGVDSILHEVRQFLDRNPSEFVIVRITKTKLPQRAIASVLNSSLAGRLFTTTTLVNIAQMQIQHLRGKAICVFEPTSGVQVRPQDGIHPFFRHGEGVHGIVTCGKYSNDSRLHKVVAGQVKNIDEHALKHDLCDHLFCLYWTQTFNYKKPSNLFSSKNIRKFTTKPFDARRKGQISGGAHHNMDYMKYLVETGMNPLGKQQKLKVMPTTREDRIRIMPNVVMYDFVNARTSAEIVSLNRPGLIGHVVEDDDDDYDPFV